MEKTFREIPDLIEYASEYGIKYITLTPIKVSQFPAQNNRIIKEDIFLDKEKVKLYIELCQEIHRIATRKAITLFDKGYIKARRLYPELFRKGELSRRQNNHPICKLKVCPEPWTSMHIELDGSVKSDIPPI